MTAQSPSLERILRKNITADAIRRLGVLCPECDKVPLEELHDVFEEMEQQSLPAMKEYLSNVAQFPHASDAAYVQAVVSVTLAGTRHFRKSH